MEENIVFVSFTEQLRCGALVVGYDVNDMLHFTFGDFDNSQLKTLELSQSESIQKKVKSEYWKARKGGYVDKSRKLSTKICNVLELPDVWMCSFEPDGAFDDRMLVFTQSHQILGFVMVECDAEHFIKADNPDIVMTIKDIVREHIDFSQVSSTPISSATTDSSTGTPKEAKEEKPKVMWKYFKGHYLDEWQDFHTVEVWGTEDINIASQEVYRQIFKRIPLSASRKKLDRNNKYDAEIIKLYEEGIVHVYD